MPLHNLGGGCWRWGEQGKKYCGPGARNKALRQGAAEHANAINVFIKELTGDELAIAAADSEIPMFARLELGKALREQRENHTDSDKI